MTIKARAVLPSQPLSSCVVKHNQTPTKVYAVKISLQLVVVFHCSAYHLNPIIIKSYAVNFGAPGGCPISLLC